MAIDKERRSAKDHARYLRQRDAFLARSKEWRQKHPERSAVITRRQWEKRKQDPARYARYLSSAYSRQRERRITVLEHYSDGVPQCCCCGEWRIEFLSLDHKAGDGAEHRRLIGHGRGSNIYLWAIRNGFPNIFQVLCMNCNCARGFYGYCPHDDRPLPAV